MSSASNHAYRGTAGWRYAAPPDSANRRGSSAARGSTAAAKKVAKIFAAAGVEICGRRRWDIQVYDERFYQRLLSDGALASGESYMDGWWDAEALDELCSRVHGANLAAKVGEWKTIWLALKGRIFNRQTKSRSAEVAQEHYDLGNDIYKAMLDPRMQYTCGYWKDATTLNQAQEDKLRLICRKVQLEPGMTVLELGGGFGGLAHFMASEYGCRVVSYNISEKQVAYAREWCRGLPVRFEQKDYREAESEAGGFDRVVSIGLCEHIGVKNYPAFFELAHQKAESRRAVPAPHDRRQCVPHLHRRMDGQVHLPQRDDSLGGAIGQGDGRSMGGGRLAQFRSGLRQDADGMVGEFRPRMAAASE